MMLELKTTKEMLIQCAVYCQTVEDFFLIQCRVGLKTPEKSVLSGCLLSFSKRKNKHPACFLRNWRVKKQCKYKIIHDEILVVGT